MCTLYYYACYNNLLGVNAANVFRFNNAILFCALFCDMQMKSPVLSYYYRPPDIFLKATSTTFLSESPFAFTNKIQKLNKKIIQNILGAPDSAFATIRQISVGQFNYFKRSLISESFFRVINFFERRRASRDTAGWVRRLSREIILIYLCGRRSRFVAHRRRDM